MIGIIVHNFFPKTENHLAISDSKKFLFLIQSKFQFFTHTHFHSLPARFPTSKEYQTLSLSPFTHKPKFENKCPTSNDYNQIQTSWIQFSTGVRKYWAGLKLRSAQALDLWIQSGIRPPNKVISLAYNINLLHVCMFECPTGNIR